MSKKLLLLFAGLVAGVLVLASCTSPAEEQDSTGPEETPGEVVELQEVEFNIGQMTGGPVKISASGSDTRWILPGLRRLDPSIFGTPENPLGYGDEGGLPLGARLTTDDGKAYTTTAMPTPFSDNFAQVDGSFTLKAEDATFVDGPSTDDWVDFTASFTGPNGKQYDLTVNKVMPMGPDHSFFGGVATNIIHHGSTGIGTNLMPQVYTYMAFWGIGELSIDGQVVASNRMVHAMLTSSVRDEDYKILFEDGVDNSRIHFHLILPPIEITPQGPQDSPVPTSLTLPNGMEQPFLHIMYEDVSINSALIVK